MIPSNIPQEWKIDMDFDNKQFSNVARILKPTVYQDGDSYCCLLGPDPATGIFGCANNPIDAVQDWEVTVHQRIGSPMENDEVAKFVIESLNASENGV